MNRTNTPERQLPDPAVTPTLSVQEAGAILGIGRSLAYTSAHDGSIPTIQLGRRLVVPTAALLRMLEHAGQPPAA